MFKNPFSFSGRIRRLEYGLSIIIYMVAGVTIQIFLESVLPVQPGSIIFLFVLLPLLWFMIAQGAKRCHDRGNTGWYQLIPFYGLWMLFAESEYGVNPYGVNPKGMGNID